MLKKAQFVTSMAQYRPAGMLKPFPQIALAGKSNVGKSSLINRLANHTKLAKTSSEPGKTRLINFYLMEDCFYLVDLPGYGYAKASQEERKRWSGMIEGYFANAQELKCALQLVDIRHKPTEQDVMMVNYLRHYRLPFCVVDTKCDKVSRAERSRNIPVICRTLAVQPWEIFTHSAQTGFGTDALEAFIRKAVGLEEDATEQAEEGGRDEV